MAVTMKDLGIDRLSVPEQLALVDEILDHLAADVTAMPVTEAQRHDLQRRLDAYRDNPKAGSPWTEVKARLQGRS